MRKGVILMFNHVYFQSHVLRDMGERESQKYTTYIFNFNGDCGSSLSLSLSLSLYIYIYIYKQTAAIMRKVEKKSTIVVRVHESLARLPMCAVGSSSSRTARQKTSSCKWV